MCSLTILGGGVGWGGGGKRSLINLLKFASERWVLTWRPGETKRDKNENHYQNNEVIAADMEG